MLWIWSVGSFHIGRPVYTKQWRAQYLVRTLAVYMYILEVRIPRTTCQNIIFNFHLIMPLRLDVMQVDLTVKFSFISKNNQKKRTNR